MDDFGRYVLQDHLPTAPWMAEATRRLPGVQPLGSRAEWLARDEAFAGQMALRDRLVATRRGDVIAACPGAEAAVAELYDAVLRAVAEQGGYRFEAAASTRPDGVRVPLDEGDKLGTLARLVQQDLCVMEKPDGAAEHVLTAAVLCFPASWTLAEKIGRPLGAIHTPVARYDGDMARRVQRLFDNLRPDTPLWRQNAMLYVDPALFHPRTEDDPRDDHGGGQYLRSEKQVLLRLENTRAVVFSIHNYIVRVQDLTAAQRAGLGDLT
ncbi:heme-dependent oxidative N-demethylase family protein [Gymnodinialimonas sp.]